MLDMVMEFFLNMLLFFLILKDIIYLFVNFSFHRVNMAEDLEKPLLGPENFMKEGIDLVIKTTLEFNNSIS